MRVLVVDPHLQTLPYDKAFCRALATCGNEVFMVGRPFRPTQNWNVPEVQYLPIGSFVRSAPTGRLMRQAIKWKFRWGLISLRSLIRQLQPDIVHYEWVPMPLSDRLIVRSKRSFPPTILTVHDTAPVNEISTIPTASITILKTFDHLIVHTNSGVSRLASLGIPLGHITRIAHGPLKLEDSESKPDHEAPNGTVYFVLFGVMRPYKGIDVLIKAVSELTPEIRGRCKFMIAGKPSIDVDQLRNLIVAHGVSDNIELFPQWFSETEIATLFKKASAFVFPYHEIDVSGVLMLALTFGKPIVASKIGGFSEILTDGEHGYLVAPGDPSLLAEALTKIVVDPAARSRFGQNVKALATSEPSWEDVAQSTTQLYRSLKKSGN